jgi:uncharacterized protein YkwD
LSLLAKKQPFDIMRGHLHSPKTKDHIMPHLFLLTLLLIGTLSEGFTFAVSKNYCCRSLRTARTSPLLDEDKTIEAINKVREEHGLKPLKKWTQLCDCAREHSQNMASGNCSFGHDGFKKRADKMQKVAFLASFAENVAYSYNYADPVQISVDGWMNSPGHKKNILGDYEETGVGIAINEKQEFYITQLFAKRHQSSRK